MIKSIQITLKRIPAPEFNGKRNLDGEYVSICEGCYLDEMSIGECNTFMGTAPECCCQDADNNYIWVREN